MDDLLGEDWQKPAKPTTSTTSNAPPPNPSTFASSYSSLRPSPALTPARSTSPNISRPASTVNGSHSAAKPAAGDAFGILFGSKKATTNTLSIQERQKQLWEEKRRQQEQQGQQWDTLGSGRGTPEVRGSSPALSKQHDEEDDIMAAFNKDAPVDKSSHFPPPSSAAESGRSTPAQPVPAKASASNGALDEDDDPFGLGTLPQRSNAHTPTAVPQFNGDDDDILGDLGKPVAPRPAPAAEPARAPAGQGEHESWGNEAADDKAVAELVDMGFPADTAKLALAENGGDVQGAVGWLLQQAHEVSKQKMRADAVERRRSPSAAGRTSQRRPREQDGNVPAWMRHETRSGSANGRRNNSRSPANGEKDAAAVAQEYGSKFLKGATSLWKASQKQMAKTVAEFQQERDPSQPKWMQEASADSSRSSSQRRPDAARAKQREPDTTDEAAMLDAPRERPQKPARPPAAERPAPSTSNYRDPEEPLPHRPAAQPKFMQQPAPAQPRPATKLTRQDVEDQAAQAYVSSARRRKAPPKPEPQPDPGVDLFSPAPANAIPPKSSSAATAPRSAPSPAPHRPRAAPRNVPSISPSALATSAQHRKAGGEAFKRGDYASAHESYSAALRPLPAPHPLTIIVLSNRALTALKTGDPKLAISDADQALEVIGPSQGIGESIDLGAGEGIKEMREFYGKALMRKADALEHLEKWSEAAAVWRTAVEGGIGGAVSLRGRDRCEKSAAPKPAAAAPRKPAPSAPSRAAAPAKSLGNSVTRPTLPGPKETAAVNKLRAQNAAADRADDEKFALTDQVEARLTAWKGGKADNLRALLQSLDSVLWEGAGWKKVGMSDLVLPNKVKIVYMRAIGKVHPDKISQDATTEQRMISAAVFSVLNEAWDKFKADNGL